MTDNKLAHAGVKGMKWGVRKDDSEASSARAAAKVEKTDAKWIKKQGGKTALGIYNDVADKMNRGGIDAFNNQPKYKDKDFTNDSPLRRQYFKEYSEMFTREMNVAASKSGILPSGQKKLNFEYDVENDFMPQWEVVDR